jgi:hypothetical protein
VVFENFTINIASLPPGTLQAGGNVLAIHALNTNAASSDMLVLPKLLKGIPGAGGVGIPNAQVGNPQINFGALDVNPVSGNQDEEYIELHNARDLPPVHVRQRGRQPIQQGVLRGRECSTARADRTRGLWLYPGTSNAGSACACIRQMIRLTSQSLSRPFVVSPNTSAYRARSSPTVMRRSAASSLPTFRSMRISLP